MAHAGYLRDFAPDAIAFTQHIWSLARASGHRPPEEAVQAVNNALTDLTSLDRATVAFAVALTWTPGLVTHDHHAPLRAQGLDDRAIHDIVQVVACFSFMNRLADGTGVTLLPARHRLAVELFGEAALADHLAWGSLAP